MSRKIVSIALSVSSVVWLLGGVMPVQGATAADIQAQINALLAQIQSLQSQLGTGGSSAGATTAYNYTRDLTVGSKGADVTALQNFLMGQPSAQWPSGQAATGNFGNITKAAVAKFQAAVGLTPAAGYFGPKTRAYVASLAAGGTGGTGGSTGGGVVIAPASGLAVSFASDNPSGAASLISGAARTPVLGVNYTAGNSGAVTITGVKFTKTGVVSDSSISGAYLVRNGQVLAQYNSLSNGVITFNGMSISIPAGQTQELWLAVDVASGVTAGNTVAFKVASVTDVSATDVNNTALTPTGIFPVQSTSFTVSSVTNPSLATLGIASSTVGSTVYAGTQGVLVSQWTNTVTNSKVKLTSINFRVIGSANKADIRNVKLYINGTQVGNTLPQVDANGFAYFDLTSAPASMGTGNSNMQIYADIAGSPSFNFQFELLNSYDVYAIDTQYNVPVAVTITGGSGVSVTINPGQLTVSLATDSPTGNVAKGQSGVTIAKFSIFAAGEAVKVKYLDYSILLLAAGKTVASEIKNIALVDDAGNQVGSTSNTPPSSNTCTGTGSAAATSTSGGSYSLVDCFGTSASPINYIIPANTTRVLSMRVDIQTGADFTSIKGSLSGNTSNLQGLTSSASNNTTAVSGSALSLASSSLTVAANSAIGTQTVTKNAAGVRIGSYAFTASTAEGVTISNITITSGASANTNFSNLRVKVASTQFGSAYPTLAASTPYTFSGTPFSIPAGQTVVLDVYADVLSGASGTEQASTLSGCSGTGLISFSAISCSTSPNGQSATIGDVPSLTVAIDSGSTAPVGQVIMGTTQNPLATFRFTETTNNEDVKITDLNVFQLTTSTRSAFGNLTLYQGSTPVGTAGSAVSSTNSAIATSSGAGGLGYYYKFHFATPVLIPKAQSVSLTLKGDVASFTSNGAIDTSTSTFKIATSSDSDNNATGTTVVALGNSSNQVSSISLSSPTGNTQTVLRSNVLVTGAALGTAVGRNKSTVDDIGTLNFTASNSGGVAVNAVRLTIAGTLPSTTASTFNLAGTDVKLFDTSTGAIVAGTLATTSCTGGSCTVTYNIGSTTSGYQLSAGASKAFTIRVNSFTNVAPGTNGVSLTLSAYINAAADVTFTDAIDGTGVSVTLPTTAVPVTVNSVSYAAGS